MGELMRRLFDMKVKTIGMRWFFAAMISLVAFCYVHQLRATGSRAQTTQVPPTQDPAGQKNSSGSTEQTPAHKYFTDVVLINQNGEKMRFYSDLLQGKVVIINSFFATCQGSCLPMNRNLEKVQEALGDHIGKDVFIISISVDPAVDTPASLKEYATKLNAKPGWYFVTGDPENVGLAL